MNEERRKQIAEIATDLQETYSDIEGLRDEEQEAFDCLPEAHQESKRGDAMHEAIDCLDSASSCVQDALDLLEVLV